MTVVLASTNILYVTLIPNTSCRVVGVHTTRCFSRLIQSKFILRGRLICWYSLISFTVIKTHEQQLKPHSTAFTCCFCEFLISDLLLCRELCSNLLIITVPVQLKATSLFLRDRSFSSAPSLSTPTATASCAGQPEQGNAELSFIDRANYIQPAGCGNLDVITVIRSEEQIGKMIMLRLVEHQAALCACMLHV